MNLRAPGKVAAATGGRAIAVADTGNDRVLVLDLAAGDVVEHADLRAPQGVRFGPGGALVVCEHAAGRVVWIGADGARTDVAAGFDSPMDVAVDADSSLVVAEAGRHRLWRIPLDGPPFVLAGSGYEGLIDDAGTRAGLSAPSGIARGTQGMFVVDAFASALRVVDSAGCVATLVGGRGRSGLADGPPSTARMDHALGVAAAPDGSSIYLADTGNNRLRLWSGVDGELQTIDVRGLVRPSGIDVLPDGRLVVADTGNDRVIIVDLARNAVEPLAAE